MSLANQVYWAVVASMPLTSLACFSYFLIAEIGKSLKPVVLSRIATIALVFCAATPLIVAAWITAFQMNASADAMPVFEAGSMDSQSIESPSDANAWELALIQAIPQLGLVIVSVIVLMQVRHVVGFVLQAATVSRQE